MEQDTNGGSDVGRDHTRDLGDEPAPAIRDAPPDYFAPIAEDAPVSGHVPAPEPTSSPAESPEQDWTVARALIYPAFRPVGTQGLPIESVDREWLATHASQSHAQPLEVLVRAVGDAPRQGTAGRLGGREPPLPLQ